MNVGAAGTSPLNATGRLSSGSASPPSDDLSAKLKDLEKAQLEELIKAAQTYGPKMAMQLAQQMMGGGAGSMKGGDFNLSEVDGSKPRGTTTAQNASEDLEKLLKDILKKQETAQASSGAQSAGSQGQQQRPPADLFAINAPKMHEMY
jgi:hypothetical protein